MRVPIPEESIDLQVMVDSFNLLGRLARRDCQLVNTAVVDAELDNLLRCRVTWEIMLSDVKLPREVILTVDPHVWQPACLWIIELTLKTRHSQLVHGHIR